VKQSCLKNTYHETFDEFSSAIDREIELVNTTLKEELNSLFVLNFQIVDTKNQTRIL